MVELSAEKESLRYLELGDEIKALEAERALVKEDLDAGLPVGYQIRYKNNLYEWVEYERSSTAWKGLYEGAFVLLDDQGQVIMDEREAKAKSKKKHKKFERKG